MDKQTAPNEYDRVKEDLQLLRDDLASLTKVVTENQKSSADNLKEEISRETRATLDQLRKRGDAALARATEAGSNTVEGVEHKIEERPFLSIVLMFLAGVIVGKILDR